MKGMLSTSVRSVVAALCLLGTLLASAVAVRADRAPALAAAPPAAAPPASLAAAVAPLVAAAPEAKLDATLTAWAKSRPAKRDWIMVQSTARLDLAAYGWAHQFTWPAGEEVALLEATAKQAQSIAALDGVYAVESLSAEAEPNPNVPAPQPATVDPAALAAIGAQVRDAADWATAAPAHAAFTARADAARAEAKGPRPTRRGGPAPKGWYDVRSGHSASEAWDLGFRGEGVAVAVLDYEVEYGHPDLQGTWKILPDGHPYAGWPEVFDPIVGFLAVQDKRQPNPMLRSTRANQFDTTRVELYQTSTITATAPAGDPAAAPMGQVCVQPRVADYTPALGQLAAIRLGTMDCSIVVPMTSKGGTVRYGHHPDVDLAFIAAAAQAATATTATFMVAWPGIVAIDEGAAGVYDTVYVDMDGDRDFTDEKPVRKGDPLAIRDFTNPPDGITDASGGLFYWIADGVNPFPGSWLWGLEGDIPAAGSEVGVFVVTRGGDHGTLCASNVVSQGRLSVPADRDLVFRDLMAGGGNGSPPAVNYGMAPDAKLVSIGNVYDGRAGARAAFQYGWRFAAFGTDRARSDDDIQVTSNSYGWSNVDSDGWDVDSRLIDHYVRTFADETSWLTATGNGGAGYGTIAPPSPSTGIDVAASTQYGSSGWHSITDTAQITYGDIVPFSNRGPGATGQVGPDLAANGGYGTGASLLNFMWVASGVDSRHAFGTWAGTSRSTPVAAGAMALVYDAFRGQHGRWPSWAEARSILKGGARFAGYDALTMGAGVVDAADAVRIAGGLGGVRAMPDEWNVGGYRGRSYDGFAKLVAPGEVATKTFTLTNDGDAPVTVDLKAMRLRRLKGQDGSVTLRAEAESSANTQLPDYIVPLQKDEIPAGTELLVFRGRIPMDQFDPDGDVNGSGTTFNNVVQASVIQHTDIDGDGTLWRDVNGNGAVNYRTLFPMQVTTVSASGTSDYYGIEGGITAPMGGQPFGPHQIAWYGLGCNQNDGSPPEPAQDVSEKIALIERGTCTFVEKIRNAVNAGAIGVLVFSDVRPVVIMGAATVPDPPLGVPGVMIPRPDGLEIRDRLQNGEAMTARFGPSSIRPNGLDGGAAVDYTGSELDRWEFQRFSHSFNYANTFEISVHHPLERWSDGIYLGLSHTERSPALTETVVSYRLDSYAYQPWNTVHLSDDRVTVPANGEATFTAMFHTPADATSGVWQGAIVAEYDRAAGDVPIQTPGGYETPRRRHVIPVVANVAQTYNWKGAIPLGGEAANDPDATYNNGAVRGQQSWNWRPESGDWRFFFVDALQPPGPGHFWIFRTQWDDEPAGQTDVDTRIWGPVADRFSNPADPANESENMADEGWYGPHGMEMKGGSVSTIGVPARPPAYWPFQTNSGSSDEWFSSPARGNLFQVAWDNILAGGYTLDVDVSGVASSMQVSASTVGLWGDTCADLRVVSQLDIPQFSAVSYSSRVYSEVSWTARQDDPAVRSSAHLKEDVSLQRPSAGLVATLDAPDPNIEPGLDLDLLVLNDSNHDGLFDQTTEVIGQSVSEFADEEVRIQGLRDAGDYQIWVHGYTVARPVTYTLRVEVLDGTTFTVRTLQNEAGQLHADVPKDFRICASGNDVESNVDEVDGVLLLGPSSVPSLFVLPLRWYRNARSTLMLPILHAGEELR